MTTHLGTFIPLQTQGIGVGAHGINHNFGIGVSGFNPNIVLGQAHAHNHQNAHLYFVPTYGANQGEIVEGILPNGSRVAFIPNHNHIAGNGFIPNQAHIAGSAFVPANPAIQGINNGAALGLHGGSHLGGIALGNTSISHSFATELFENSHEYVLSFDVPGIDIEDLDISLSGNTVYINGIRKESREASTLAYSEIAKGNITRAISVPFDVSSNKAINTSLENGVLKIRIAKENHGEKRPSARKVKIG